MYDSITIVSLIIAILFGIYELWAFRNNKTLSRKLLPSIFMVILGLLVLVLTAFIGPIGYFWIFVILIIELSIKGVMVVIFLEICLAFFSAHRSIKRILNLSVIFTLLVISYYLWQRVF